MSKTQLIKLTIALGGGALVALAGLGGSYILPLDNQAIQYATRPTDDPITRLQARIQSGDVKLRFDDEHGYLSSVLEALDVPVQSQILVYSKTSFQAPSISPRMPRALYFNDDVSVGFVRGATLSKCIGDPRQGVMFYTIDQEKRPTPRFDRQDPCLQCHAAGSTLGIPGLLFGRYTRTETGCQSSRPDHLSPTTRSPLKERWGGWYVTGAHGKQTHRGNAVVRDKNKPEELETEGTQNVTDLKNRFDTGAYLTPHSDIAALMVMEHQTHMTNLITRVGYEARMAVASSEAINKALGEPVDKLSESSVRRINNASEELVEYMLFSGEARITSTYRQLRIHGGLCERRSS